MTRYDEFPMVVHAQTVGVIRLHADGWCTYISESARRILGVKSSKVGDPYTSWPLPADVRQFIDAMLTSKGDEGQATIYANQRVADPTSDRDYLSFATPLRDGGIEVFVIERPSVRHAIGATYHTHAATLAEVAAGVAHEVRNPLTAVKGFLQLLTEQHEPRYVQVALQEVDRAVRILNSLLSISRPDDDEEELRSVDVCAMMDSVALLFEDHFYSIPVRKIYNDPGAIVWAKPEQLKKALFNLVKNAIEAMPSGGVLTLEERVHRGYTSLSVRDTGGGISHDILIKLGTPFVSNKEGGTGLGVAMVHNMMTDLGGRMDVESSREGTAFTLYFPQESSDALSDPYGSSNAVTPSHPSIRTQAAEVVPMAPLSEVLHAEAETAAGQETLDDPVQPPTDSHQHQKLLVEPSESSLQPSTPSMFVPVTVLTERVRIVTVPPRVLERNGDVPTGPFVEAAVRTVAEQLQREVGRPRVQVVIDVTHVNQVDSMFPVLCQSLAQVMRSLGHSFVFAGMTTHIAKGLREQLQGEGLFPAYVTVPAALHDLGISTLS